MTDKTVAELMALALRVKDTGGAYDYGEGDEAPYREARDALEQAIRRAVDFEQVAEVSHFVGGGPNDVGIRWRGGLVQIGTPLYARNKP